MERNVKTRDKVGARIAKAKRQAKLNSNLERLINIRLGGQ